VKDDGIICGHDYAEVFEERHRLITAINEEARIVRVLPKGHRLDSSDEIFNFLAEDKGVYRGGIGDLESVNWFAWKMACRLAIPGRDS